MSVEITGTEKLNGAYDLVKTDKEQAADALASLLERPTPPEYFGRLKFRKCPHCGGRPSIIEKRDGLVVEAGVPGQAYEIKRYDLLPCCTARHVKANEGLSRLQLVRLRAAEAEMGRAK